MKAAWFALPVVCVLAMTQAARGQTLNPPPRAILNDARPLQPAEVASVVAAAREAASGKTFRLSYVANGRGPEILMGQNGRPRYVRSLSGYDSAAGHVDVLTFTEYTNRLARKCAGAALGAELVIEYEHKSTDNRWTVRARTWAPVEPLSPVFEILSGGVAAESGDRRPIDDRKGRAFTAPWLRKPADAFPDGVRQTLWIDSVSMLPLRWSLSVPAMPDGTPAIPNYGLSFTHDATLVLQPPDVGASIDCVP